MTSLDRTQTDFQNFLLGCSTSIVEQVRGNARIGESDLLHVYRHGYWARLVEALANDFPGLCGLLGADAFDRLSRDYLAANPSRHPSLRWLGRGIASHLDQFPVEAQPLAAGMARFDWAVAQAFDARDQIAVTMTDILALPPTAWESLRLTFTDAVSDLVADSSIGELRRAILHDAGEMPAAREIGQRWIVWRQDEDVQYRPVADDEAAAFDLIRDGATFGVMCQHLSDHCRHPAAAVRSAEILKDWLDRGLVAEIAHDATVSV
ncbi:MAG: putative DNA-binding domain-containing protein [Rhodospirillaceae bacterium]|nr:putative DNA-binding domain-containing protein [Rhodospirillaceae bacterium]